ncbi:Fis family transcriptional regulator [Vibrio injensis]|uniref:Fis family transcriptional regulator n=1 Tax=Vibrio injensis TaxID=1307414 RepID=UPI0009340B16|nr:Fis family transcriptional regulator [Vibrio injensis]
MRKSDKKIENLIREVLTEVCESTLKDYDGFLWVTHTVKYTSFPQSLAIVCVFETNQYRANFLLGEGRQHVSTTIQKAFNQVGVPLKNADKQISYDIQQKR